MVFDLDTINPGGHYNSATGIYTVPIDGVYQLTVHLWEWTDTAGSAFLVVDNIRVGLFIRLLEFFSTKEYVCAFGKEVITFSCLSQCSISFALPLGCLRV